MSNGDYFDVDIDRLVEWAETNGFKYKRVLISDGVHIEDPVAGTLKVSRKGGVTITNNGHSVNIEQPFIDLIQDLAYHRAEGMR